MREILFRGKCNEVGIYTGQWIEGFYAEDDGKPVIGQSTDKGIISYFCEIGSIGQFTGLTDKNGRKIFEGDIIKIVPDYDYSDDYSISKVYSYNGILCVDYHGDDFDSTALGFLEDYLPDGDFEVIGNIHDNPEMLGGESDG